MSTLPRISKSTLTPPSVTFFQSRPVSDFDAGLNSSAAWKDSLEQGSNDNCLSDEELEHEDEESGRLARALYAFEGKAEFRELSVEAGDALEVLREHIGEGWSLVRLDKTGEVGLLPESYYTFTSEMAASPTLDLPTPAPYTRRREPSAQAITPRGSPKSEIQALPLIPQHTGEWFPSFRQSLLGGKSLNRFSTFVTSGAEEWVLKGSNSTPPHSRTNTEDEENDVDDNRMSRIGTGEADRHYVDVGPTWKTKVPPFRVLVHSPSKRTSTLSGAYTIYNVTSLFYPTNSEDEDTPPGSPMRITVQRRFSHFVVLHTALSRRLPGIALPPLPEKQYAGRFSDEFVEARRGDLERYISRIVRHPVARYAEVLTFFLGCESETEWKRQLPYHLSLPAAGPSFYAHVFHPAFNLDAEDAVEAVDRFDTHTRSVGKGVQSLRNIFGQVREARVEMSKAERLLAYTLLSAITSKPLASAPSTGIGEEEEEDAIANGKTKGHMNEDGAWCWRENCKDCLKLTKAMQRTSETLQSVADLYDDHARRTQLATHEALKGVAHPSSLYAGVVETHRSTLSRYNNAASDNSTDEEVASRCETVLNTTMAEMETYHTQKLEDFRTMTTEHLDGEIAFYEQILHRLKSARRAFDTPQYDHLGESPRQPSIYERELENPRLTPSHLPQPCPHVFDSAPMRPVSVAIQEGVGMLFRNSGRSSVFGKFW